jgi:hypothetical protein
MVSLILPMPRFEPALLDTLAACVPAVADGLIREALVVTPATVPALDPIIDAAGCGLLRAEGDAWALLQAAAGQARSPWLLVMTPGLVPTGGWIAACDDFRKDDDPTTIGLARRTAKGSWLQRLTSTAAQGLAGMRPRPPLDAALIHQRAVAEPQKARRHALDFVLSDRRRAE